MITSIAISTQKQNAYIFKHNGFFLEVIKELGSIQGLQSKIISLPDTQGISPKYTIQIKGGQLPTWNFITKIELNNIISLKTVIR